jgi:hypothetical protein
MAAQYDGGQGSSKARAMIRYWDNLEIAARRGKNVTVVRMGCDSRA